MEDVFFLLKELWGFILILLGCLRVIICDDLKRKGGMLVVHWLQHLHRNSKRQGPKRQREAHDHDVVWDRPWVSRHNSPLNVFVGIFFYTCNPFAKIWISNLTWPIREMTVLFWVIVTDSKTCPESFVGVSIGCQSINSSSSCFK